MVLQLEFATGDKRKEVSVSIVDDNMIESMKSFQLSLSITSDHDIISKGVQLGPNAAVTVTIKDNDGELILANKYAPASVYTALDLIPASWIPVIAAYVITLQLFMV